MERDHLIERYGDRDGFYRDHSSLAAGWSWKPGDHSRGTAPFGADELFGVPSEDSADLRRWLITLAAPARQLGPFWDRSDQPVTGAVTATDNTTGEVLVLAAGIDLRPMTTLRYLPSPTLETVASAVERGGNLANSSR